MDQVLLEFPKSRKELHLEIIDENVLNDALLKLWDNIINETFKLKESIASNKSDIIDTSNLLSTTEYLLDYIWEHLHTGEWKNINLSWRYLYSYASLFKTFSILAFQNEDSEKDTIIKAVTACDMGLIMGATILDGLLSRIAQKLNKIAIEISDFSVVETRVSDTVSVKIDPLKRVDSFHVPTIETFLCEIMNMKPAMFTGNLSLFVSYLVSYERIYFLVL